MIRLVALATVAACGSREPSASDPPAPSPEHPTVPDAPAFTGCPYQIYRAHLTPLVDGSLIIGPQSTVSSKAPQYAPEQRLDVDGRLTPVPAGATHVERDFRLFLSSDGGSLGRGTTSVGFDFDPQLVAYNGYASAAGDPKGRSLVLTFSQDDHRPELIVSFDAKGKRRGSWSSTKLCEERAELVVGGTAVMTCRTEADPWDVPSRLAIRELATGKLQAHVRGAFREMYAAVIDDSHFVVWSSATHTLDAYDLTTPTRPRRIWTAPLAFELPAIAIAAGGVVAIGRDRPWEGVVLDPATGAVVRRLAVDPCKR